MLKKLLALIFASGVLLAACTGNSSTSNGGSPVVESQAGIVIDPMSTVPVLNGTGTQGTLYIHNYTNQVITGLNFSLNQATLNSQVKSLIAKAGLNLGGSLEDQSGFVLLNSERCIKIGANSSCAINFSTPNLNFGNQGSSLVSVSYKLNGKSITNSQVVNYSYIDGNLSTGVNFTGNVDVSGISGTTKYIVGYLYGGASTNGIYKNVNLVSSNPTVTISGGFINNQEVAPNQVIAVEYRIAIQNNQKSYVEITPTWGNSVSSISRSNVNNGSGSILGVVIEPQQNVANYLFGNVPILTAKSDYQVRISVVNNGNTDGAAITANKIDGDVDGITIDTSNCTAGTLKANADGSCQIIYTVNTYTPGSTTVEYMALKNGVNTVVGSQIIYWNNDKPVPAVSSIPSIKNVGIERESDSADIQFNFENIGKAPLESMKITLFTTGPAAWKVTESNCTTDVLAVDGGCYIKGHLEANSNNGLGTVYYIITGSYADTTYSFSSIPLRYAVLATPEIVITPAEVVNVVITANDESAATNTYVAKNIGNDPALLSGISLSAMTTSHNPVITNNGTCNIGRQLGLNESCTIVVTYGPEPVSVTTNESGSTHILVNYHGGTPDIDRLAKSESYNYTLIANDTYIIESVVISGFESGSGTLSEPYVATALNESGQIKVTYTNSSENYPLDNFNLNTNDLPYGIKVVSNSCATGSSVITLAVGAHCEIIFGIDSELLRNPPQGGSTVFDFTTPTATWTSPFGFYTEPGNEVHVSYLQPTVNFSLSKNNGAFESTVLTASLTNASSGVSPFVVNISSINDWVESKPIALSGNCSVNPDFSASCSLSSGINESGYIAYIMPKYILANESAMIPLFYSTAGLGALSPTYNFITYIAPLPLIPEVTGYTRVGGGGAGVGEAYGLTAGGGALYAVVKAANASVKKVLLSNMVSSWSEVSGTANTGTPIRLAYDTSNNYLLISRTNGNVAYSVFSGTPSLISGSYRFSNNTNSNINANVLGLVYESGFVYAYAPDRNVSSNNFAKNTVENNSNSWTNMTSFSSATLSLYVGANTTIESSACYGSAYDRTKQRLYEGGCSSNEKAIYMNGAIINTDNLTSYNIRSMLYAESSLFIGDSNGFVYRVDMN